MTGSVVGAMNPPIRQTRYLIGGRTPFIVHRTEYSVGKEITCGLSKY